MVVCMNKERYLKLKKDFIVLYLARNGIMTFLITLFTFSLDLSNYYQISFPATIPYIFFNNIFTLMYFCLLWIFNYLLFELFKIINDWYDENHYQTLKFMYHEHNYSMSVDSVSLLNSIDRASLLSNEQTNIIKLSMSEDNVMLSSYSQEIGSVEENLSKAFYKGDDLSISFSAKYLNDAIKSINGEKVKVLFTGEMKPFIIMDFEKDDIIQLVLPVRTY